MKIELYDKIALVTGSTAGIGYAIARGLAATGAEVVINGRTQARVDDAVARLKEDGYGRVTGVVADVSNADGCRELIHQVPHADILINNMGIFSPQGFFDISDEEWEQFFQANVMSAVRLSRYYAQLMQKQHWGRIQFLSSESALQIPVEMVHYGVTKTALLAVSRGLAETLSGSGVTVNAVLPGPTRSEGVSVFLDKMAAEQGVSVAEMEASFVREHRPTSLLGRFASVEEVANLCVYLASQQASATTGAAMRVDGGVVRSIA
ncbi:oxidoreductase [Pokkaliibacter plantistimulans]|uniref:Oxidoreductase n=1 Tax=Proteobacteria bacterium 228 TaxID=2083153 RepID=A0A2S5KMC5_9PROT|nr:SDR family oxidoreductase [Pokkaliibacter plantistimulans]PPC75890.1 oxidoreductase [Pokkaliibacter plantistimulans]